MEQLIYHLLNERQMIIYKIYNYLSTGKKKTTKEIYRDLENQNIQINKNSSVLYKYLNKLVDLGLISYEISGNSKFYFLTRENETLNLSPLKSDVPFFYILNKTLENYPNLPLKHELEIFLKKHKVLDSMQLTYKIIDFDSSKSYVNDEYLSYFYYRILDQETVHFSYKKFEESKPKSVTLQPYLIKEFEKRWYILGLEKGNLGQFKTYSFDRIESIDWDKIPDSFERDKNFNPNDMWKDSVGLFRGKPEKVSFEVKNDHMNNIDFLISSPIHKSQVTRKLDDNWIKVELFVFPSFELIREIRKLGSHNIKNVLPTKLSKDIFGQNN